MFRFEEDGSGDACSNKVGVKFLAYVAIGVISVLALLFGVNLGDPEEDETPETEDEPDENTHSDDWGDTEKDDEVAVAPV